MTCAGGRPARATRAVVAALLLAAQPLWSPGACHAPAGARLGVRPAPARASLQVRIRPPGSPDTAYRLQYVRLRDWEAAEVDLRRGGEVALRATAAAVVAADTGVRTADVAFGDVAAGDYDVEIRLTRRDPAGTSQVVARTVLAAVAIAPGANVVEAGAPLATAARSTGPVAAPAAVPGLVTSWPARGPGGLIGQPGSLAVDAAGTVYVAELPVTLAGIGVSGNRVRKIAPLVGGGAPFITTLAGDGNAGGADGPGLAAQFATPGGVAVAPDGTVFVAEIEGHRVRRIARDANGVVTVATVAGTGAPGFADGAGAVAQFNRPRGLALAADGTLYVADQNNARVRRIAFDEAGQAAVTTVVGDGTSAHADGPGATARVSSDLGDMAFDAAGALYLADAGNNRVRKLVFAVGGAAAVTTVAGDGNPGYVDGDGATAQFNRPIGAAFDPAGRLIVSDATNARIRALTFDGAGVATVTTLAGDGTAGIADGLAATARFNEPGALAVDAAGTIYVADSQNFRVRKLETVAGQLRVSTMAGDNTPGFADGPVEATASGPMFNALVASDGRTYVVDTFHHAIRRIVPDAGGRFVTELVAGVPAYSGGLWDGSGGYADGPGAQARFNSPNAIVEAEPGTFYVTDTFNHLIRKLVIGADGAATVSTVAGTVQGAVIDGPGATAQFCLPFGLVRDPAGALYVAETGNNAIRKVVFDGAGQATVSTVAGNTGAGTVDGPAATAKLDGPCGLALAADGTLYFSQMNNTQIVRKITFDGGGAATVAHVAGAGASGFADGPGATAAFNTPYGLALVGADRLYVADTSNHRIRLIDLGVGGPTVSTVAGDGQPGYREGVRTEARFSFPYGLTRDAQGRLLIADTGNRCLRTISP